MRYLSRSPFSPKGRPDFLAAMLVGLALAACSGSGNSSTQQQDDFALVSVNVSPNAVWPLNRPIDVTFNSEVDLSTVSSNTLRVTQDNGATAVGSYSYRQLQDGSLDRKVVRFQPACPTLGDLSDAGLSSGGVFYTLQIMSTPGDGVTVQDSTGRSLELGGTVRFRTASGQSAADLFTDTVPGPPSVRVRGGFDVDPDELSATYLELGGDPDNRAYFSLDTNLVGQLPAGVIAPLNFYSRPETQVAAIVHLDQPVTPGSSNVNPGRFRLEWRVNPGQGEWSPLVSEVTLTANCTDTGAVVRIEPQGLLPQDAELRIVVGEGLSDLTGEVSPNDSERAGVFRSTSVLAEGATVGADELLERFSAGGNAPDSREDLQAVLGAPRADWGDGILQASFAFDGTGGPSGNFDLHLSPGETILIDTNFALVVGGPGGTPTTTQEVIGGVLDVRNLRVPVGAQLIFLGQNPATILASGEVNVQGEISVRGSNNNGVGSLNTANQPETGAAGNAGGGTGGTGSPLISQSTPQGGTGFGAFNSPNRGGGGGETGYGLGGEDFRRGAGGGGGRLGRDVFYDHDQNPMTPDVHAQALVGLDAENGYGGSGMGSGALSQSVPSEGGTMGPLPFLDDNDDNDFFGSQLDASGKFVQGEFDQIWAGAGGGGGGDAVNSGTFPLTPFTITGDEKGSGGGGGGGGLSILAIGPIIVENNGRIVADGGYSGGGENTFTSKRVAGGGGGGSGGHIVLSSAAFVEVRGDYPNAGDGYRDDPDINQHQVRALSALGGQGGEGRTGRGGANNTGQTIWRRDAIPLDRLEPDVPPLNPIYLNLMPDEDDPRGPALAAGGDGGPGIIQIHVEDPVTDLRFPDLPGTYGVPGGVDVTRVSTPPPLGWNGTEAQADRMLPFYGRFSMAQSEWIHLGLPSIDGDGELRPTQFFFDGTDTASGLIQEVGGVVSSLAPVVGPLALGANPGEALLADGGLSIELDITGIDPTYLAGPQLLVGFDAVFEEQVPVGPPARFEIQATSLDLAAATLTLFMVDAVTNPEEVVAQASTPVSFSVVPRYFRVETQGESGVLAGGATISVTFDATVSDGLLQPSEAQSFSAQNGGEFTADVNDLGDDPWSWVRYRVTFDLSGGGPVPLNVPRPGLRLLRLPFLFD